MGNIGNRYVFWLFWRDFGIAHYIAHTAKMAAWAILFSDINSLDSVNGYGFFARSVAQEASPAAYTF